MNEFKLELCSLSGRTMGIFFSFNGFLWTDIKWDDAYSPKMILHVSRWNGSTYVEHDFHVGVFGVHHCDSITSCNVSIDISYLSEFKEFFKGCEITK